MKNKILIFAISFIFIAICFQNITFSQNGSIKLPRNYKDFYLGMDLQNFLQIIDKVDYLLYEGKIDVSFYEVDKNLFKASVPPYIRKLIFFFYKEKLALMNFYYDNKYVNFFERYKSLVEKYGNATYVDSDRFTWEDDQTIIIFEKTNLLKVIDKIFLNQISQEFQNIENLIKISEDKVFDNF